MKKIKKAIGYILYVLTSWLPHYQLHYSWPITTNIRRLAAKMMFDYCGEKVDIGRKISFSLISGLKGYSVQRYYLTVYKCRPAVCKIGALMFKIVIRTKKAAFAPRVFMRVSGGQKYVGHNSKYV